jgi:hypothetical protein
VVSFPVDAHSLPGLAVNEVVAPGSPDSTAPDVVGDSVDAHSLPLVSVDGVEAPGFPVCTATSEPAVQLGSTVLSVSAAPPGSGNQVTEVLPVRVNVNTQFGVSVQGKIWTIEPLNRLSSFFLSQLIHGWKDDPPSLKVYSRRKKLVLEPVQDEESVLSSPLQEFKSVVTKSINSLLPPPRITNIIPRRTEEWLSFLQSWVLVLLPRSVDNSVSMMKWRTSLLRMPTDMQGYSKMSSQVAILLQ